MGKGRENHSLVFTSSTKHEIRQFHIIVVPRRQRNVQKSMMYVQSCCFANPNLLLFHHSHCHHRHCCLSSLLHVFSILEYVCCSQFSDLSSHKVHVAQWQSIWTGNQKVIGSTPVGSTQIFSSELPMSLTEKHLSLFQLHLILLDQIEQLIGKFGCCLVHDAGSD